MKEKPHRDDVALAAHINERDTSFAPDDPSRAIVAFAKRDGTDLIVMGGRSNPGSTRHGGQGR